MTWAEFQIRLFALNKQREFEKEKLNVLGNVIIGSSFSNNKKEMLNELNVMLFGRKIKKITNAQLEAIRKHQEAYNNRHKK